MVGDKAMRGKMMENKVTTDKLAAGDKVMGDKRMGDQMMQHNSCNQDGGIHGAEKGHHGKQKRTRENMVGGEMRGDKLVRNKGDKMTGDKVLQPRRCGDRIRWKRIGGRQKNERRTVEKKVMGNSTKRR